MALSSVLFLYPNLPYSMALMNLAALHG